MIRCFLLVCLPLCVFSQSPANHNKRSSSSSVSYTTDYGIYHRTVGEAEARLADQQYEEALALYKQLINNQNFVFSKEYKVATQLAFHLGKTDEAFGYLKKGIAGGWTMKSIKNNRFLRQFQSYPDWKAIEKQYPSLRQAYQKRINPEVRETVKKMAGKDQWKALGALFTFGSKGQDRYAEKTFAPHSEKQVAKLFEIIDQYGYPGEKLIGNNSWASIILSHHNSISEEYARKDTLYPNIRPKLLHAMQLGQVSPYEFAMIETWYLAVNSGHKDKGFGYLDRVLTESERVNANQLRRAIGLCSVETMNRLIDMQQKTGIDLYFPSRADFSSGKITVVD